MATAAMIALAQSGYRREAGVRGHREVAAAARRTGRGDDEAEATRQSTTTRTP